MTDTKVDLDSQDESEKVEPLETPPPLKITKSVPIKGDDSPKNKIYSNTPTTSRLVVKKRKHRRDLSVGNLVPLKYMVKAKSLINLIDSQKIDQTKLVKKKSSIVQFKSHEESTNSITEDWRGDSSPKALSEEPISINYGVKRRKSTNLSEDLDNISVIEHFTNDSKQDINRNSNNNINNSSKNLKYMDEFNKQILNSSDVKISSNPSQDSLPDLHNQLSNEVDMKELALQAAQEFMQLANENDNLSRENESLKIKLDDIRKQMSEMNDENTNKTSHNKRNSELENELMSLRSIRATQEMQISVLQDRINELRKSKKHFREDSLHSTKSVSNLPEFNYEKSINSRLLSLDTHTNNKESLASLLDHALRSLENEKQEKYELDIKYTKLNNELKNYKIKEQTYIKQIEELNFAIDKQESELIKKMKTDIENDSKVNEVEDNMQKTQLENISLAQRMRGMTIEKHKINEKNMLMKTRLEEQRKIIEALEFEKQELEQRLEEAETNKIQLDDDMFSQLQGLHKTNNNTLFVGGIGHNYDHSRNMSMSTSLFSDHLVFTGNDVESTSGFALGRGNNNVPDLISVRTKNIINDLVDNNELVEVDENESSVKINSDDEKDEKEKEEELKKKSEEEKKKKEEERKRKLKRLEIQKAQAEREFFFLTCIAVKTNLGEEFPQRSEEIMLNESPVELYKIAQVQTIPMFKFNIFIETRIRQKYKLPKLERGKKLKMPKIKLRRPSLHLQEKFQQINVDIQQKVLPEVKRKMTAGIEALKKMKATHASSNNETNENKVNKQKTNNDSKNNNKINTINEKTINDEKIQIENKNNNNIINDKINNENTPTTNDSMSNVELGDVNKEDKTQSNLKQVIENKEETTTNNEITNETTNNQTTNNNQCCIIL